MRVNPVLVSRLRIAAMVVGAWTLVGLVAIAGGVAAAVSSARPLPTTFFFVNNVLGMWMWALSTPIIFKLCDRRPLDAENWGRNAWPHAGLLLLAWTCDFALGLLLEQFVDHPQRTKTQLLFGGLIYCVIFYVGAAAVGHARRLHRLYLERAIRASELESQLLRSQLTALQMQLRPHFLFNALNTVSGLVRTNDRDAALQVIAGLGDLLRAVLRGDGSQQVPLRNEVELAERYLRIEALRFRDRLRTEFRVEPDVLDALVPQLLLQPLVENAVRHGARAEEGDARVSVHIRRRDEMLHLCVEDSGGRGTTATESESGGIGLANTRARLRHLFGERHRLSLTSTPAGGTIAEVVIPYTRAEVGR